MKILIVGGASSLAQVLKPMLSDFSEVLTAGRSGCDVYLDLTVSDAAFRLPAGIDVVINTAAYFGGKEFESMLNSLNVNVLGTLRLCQAAKQSDVKHFVSISSTSACLDETSEYFGSYALSKRQSDEVVRLFCSTFKLACTILRPTQLYGNEDSFRKHQPFLYAAVDRAMKCEDITIYGGRDALRNYLHALDFCRVIARVVTEQVEGLYTCMNPANVSLSQVAHAVIQACGSSGKVVFRNEMPDIPDNVFPYDETLYQKINYFPQVSLEEGVKRIAASRLSTT